MLGLASSSMCLGTIRDLLACFNELASKGNPGSLSCFQQTHKCVTITGRVAQCMLVSLLFLAL